MKTNKLFSYLFFSLLLFSLNINAKKSLSRKTAKIPSPSTYNSDINREDSCFYGKISDLISMLKENVDSYSSSVTDESVNALTTMIIDLSKLEVEVIKETLTEETLVTYKANIESLSSNFKELSSFNNLTTFVNKGKSKQLMIINDFWEYSLEKVIQTLATDKSAYYDNELYDYFQYQRQLTQWPLIFTDLDSCFPTEDSYSPYSYNSLTNVYKNTSYNYSKPGHKFILNDEDFEKDGGLAIAFWSKASYQDVYNYQKQDIMQIISEHRAIRIQASYEESSQKKYYNYIISVGSETEVVQLELPCDDMIYNAIFIIKEQDSYIINFTMHSYNINFRENKLFKIPANYLENGTLELFYPLVELSSINYFTSFDYDLHDLNSMIRTELEVKSIISNTNILNELNALNKICRNKDENCYSVNTRNECIICNKNFYLFDFKCIDTCPEGTFVDDDTLKCLPCNKSCLTCKDKDSCSSCHKNMFLNSLDGTCVNECPAYTYSDLKINSEDNYTCESCSDDCRQCKDNNTCIECTKNHLLEGKCVENCPRGTYEAFHPNECASCMNNCEYCKNDESCNFCKDGFYLDNYDKCVSKCQIGYYTDKNLRRCVKCSLNCHSCSNNNECEECAIGYSLSADKTCISACPSGSVLINDICLSCNTNCNYCSGANPKICTQCSLGYVLYNGRCVEACPTGMFIDENNTCKDCIENCKLCSDPFSCQQCYEPYHNYERSQCLIDCPLKYTSYNNYCISCDENCSKCNSSNPDMCEICDKGLLLYNGTCITECPRATYFDKTKKECYDCYQYGNCSTCDASLYCNSCEEGYYLFDGYCYQDCFYNYLYYYVNPELMKCEICKKEGCRDCSNNVNTCEVCNEGYLNYNGDCMKECPVGFIKIKDYYNYYNEMRDTEGKINTDCESCSLNCDNCTFENKINICQKCKDNFYLNDKKECVERCPSNYIEVSFNKECKKCENDLCERCDVNTQSCTSCINDMKLYQSNCVEVCPESTYLNSDNECVDCPYSCKSCNEKECIECNANFQIKDGSCISTCDGNINSVLINNECVKCKENCKICSSENVDLCLDCLQNYYLFDSKCLKECPLGFYSDSNNKCQECIDGCESCLEKSNCSICKDGYFYHKDTNQCLKECYPGYVGDLDDRICKKCGENCETCDSDNSEICLLCFDRRYVFNKECVDFCPPHHFINEKNHCIPCEVESCSRCSYYPDICTICVPGKYLHNNSCLDKCPEGYLQINNNSCKKCNIANCSDCDGNLKVCKKCKDNFFLTKDNSCVEECPIGSYFDKISSTCLDCGKNCSVCLDYGRCIQCSPYYFLENNGKCYSECLIGEVEVNNECKKCSSNCSKCESDNVDKCYKCKKGYYLNEDLKCSLNCNEGFYPNDAKGICESCSFNCKSCSDNFCKECNKNYSLDNSGKCIDSCSYNQILVNDKCVECEVHNCNKCDSLDLNKCLDCGEKLLFNNKCYDNCPERFYSNTNNVCIECLNNCNACSDSFTCDTCIEGFSLFNNKCISICLEGYVSVDGVCQPCDENNCYTCDTNKNCLSCKDNYYLFQNNSINECVATCPSGYKMKDNKCLKCPPGCSECSHDLERCYKCDNGLVLNYDRCQEKCYYYSTNVDGICTNCNNNCKVCDNKNTSICYECSDYYLLLNGKCYSQCPAPYVPTWYDDMMMMWGFGYYDENYNRNEAKICHLDPNKCRIKYFDFFGDYCQECINGYAIEYDKNGRKHGCIDDCGDGKFMQNQMCYECNVSHCSDCSNDKLICNTCKSGYVLSLDSTMCLNECPENQYKLNNQCVECMNNCLTCNNLTGSCTSCMQGYDLTEGECHVPDCDIGEILLDDKCVSCEDRYCNYCNPNDVAQCTQCIEGFKLHDNKCTLHCPQGTYENETGTKCYACRKDCKSCSTSFDCKSCSIPYVLNDNECINKCPKFRVPVNNICEKCNDYENCSECSSKDLSYCYKCENYFLNNGKCIKEDINTTADIDIFIKDDNCLRYNDGFCDECKYPYFIYHNKCYSECPVGTSNFYYNNRYCYDIIPDFCLASFGYNYCQNCIEGLYNNNGLCVTECTEGMTKNNLTKTCDKCLDNNCSYCNDFKNCNKCKQGYYLHNNECIEMCPINFVEDKINFTCIQCNQASCSKCSTNNQDICHKCSSGFLYNDLCVDICPINYYSEEHICKKCSFGCEECMNKSSCLKCNANFDISNSLCLSKCPIGESLINNVCIKCKDNCKNCSINKEKCEECIKPFKLHDDKCIEECPESYYSYDSKCTKCEDSCLTCSNSSLCNSCKKGFVLYNNKCYETCPISTYFDKENNRCLECKDNSKCKSCLQEDSNICLSCREGYFLSDNQCINRCPYKHFNNNENNTCDQCIDNCSVCKDNITCLKCIYGFVKFNNSCVEKCPSGYVSVNNTCELCNISNCEMCFDWDINKCFRCNEGYVMENNKCVPQCPIGKYLDLKFIPVCLNCNKTCKTCDSYDNCFTCKEGLYLQDGKCIDSCPTNYVSIEGKCTRCNQSYCNKCSPDNLDECLDCSFVDDYNYSRLSKSGRCGNCPGSQFNKNLNMCDDKYNLQYSNYDGNYCREFTSPSYKGYCAYHSNYRNFSSRFYSTKEIENCDIFYDYYYSYSYCEYCSEDYSLYQRKCLKTCPNGYYSKYKQCYNCTSNCKVCSNSDTCDICSQGYVTYFGKCQISCPVGFAVNSNNICVPCNENCEKCNPNNTTECLDCKSNFYLSPHGTCLETCPTEHYQKDDKCLPCSLNCESCDEFKCHMCEEDYYLLKGECVTDCLIGYRKDTSGKCITCSEHCNSCDKNGCSECKENYFIYNGECVLNCPDNYYIVDGQCSKCNKGCVYCSDSETCTICNDNLFLSQGKCVTVCPTGMAPIHGVCNSCADSDCSQCESNNVSYCHSCKNGYLHEGKCYDQCPEGLYADPKDQNNCLVCNSKCDACTDADTCIACNDNLYLKDGKCINECPESNILFNNECVDCNISKCTTCKLNGINNLFSCIECKAPFILHNHLCVEQCPSKYHKDNLANVCKKCPLGCEDCDDFGNCHWCINGFFLNQETLSCTQYCPSKTYADCKTSICETCNSLCETCYGSSNEECIKCSSEAVLQNDICVESCDDGYYPNENKVCEKCKIENCLKCSSEIGDVCNKCQTGFELENNYCVKLKGELKCIGSILESPNSNKYLQKSEVSFKQDLDNFAMGSKELGIIFYMRSLGTVSNLEFTQQKSHIFSLVNATLNDDISFYVNNASEELAECRIVGDDISSSDNFLSKCGNSDLFTWALFSINISRKYESENKQYFDTLGISNISTISLNVNDFEINDTTIFKFFDNHTMLYSGYQISRIHLSNYIIKYNDDSYKNVMLKKYPGELSFYPNLDYKWYTIPLLKESKDLNDSDFDLSFLYNRKESILAAHKDFGVNFYVYYSNIDESINELALVNLNYPYDKDILGKISALKLSAVKDLNEVKVDGSTVKIPLSTIQKENWYLITLYLSYSEDTVTYSIIIRDYDNKELLNQSIINKKQFNNTIKLFADIHVNFEGTGKVYGVNLLFNTLSYQRSLVEITNKKGCSSFDVNFECLQCNSNHTYNIESKECEANSKLSSAESYSLLEVYESFSNEEKQYEIPEEYFNSNHTIYLNIRKLLHSKKQKSNNNQKHTLIKYGGHAILEEEIVNDYESKFIIGSLKINKNFKCDEFSYIQVLVSINEKENLATVLIRNLLEDEDVISTINISGATNAILLGDSSSTEVNFGFYHGIVYSGIDESDDNIESILENKLVNLNPACKNGDFLTGECNECFGIIDDVDKTRCKNSILGFSSNYIFRKNSFDDISENDYVFNIRESIPYNVNSNYYGIFGRINLLTLEQLQDGTTANLNLVELRHDRTDNSLNPLIAFVVKVYNKSAKYYWIINNPNKGLIEIPVDTEVVVNEWILITSSINVSTATFKYNVITSKSLTEDGASGSFTLDDCTFERLQSIGQITTFGAKSSLQKDYQIPNASTNHLYVIPNLLEYNNALKYFKTNLLPDNNTNELINCQISVYSPSQQKNICLKCKKDFIMNLETGECYK